MCLVWQTGCNIFMQICMFLIAVGRIVAVSNNMTLMSIYVYSRLHWWRKSAFKEYEGSTITLQCMCSRPGSFRKQTWSTINEPYTDQCPDILHLTDLILTLPADSADCERGFSQSKLVKTVWRSKLHDTAITDSLTVVLQTATEADFNPEEDVHHWNSKYVRRPNKTCGDKEDTDSDSDSYLAESAEWDGWVVWFSNFLFGPFLDS